MVGCTAARRMHGTPRTNSQSSRAVFEARPFENHVVKISAAKSGDTVAHSTVFFSHEPSTVFSRLLRDGQDSADAGRSLIFIRRRNLVSSRASLITKLSSLVPFRHRSHTRVHSFRLIRDQHGICRRRHSQNPYDHPENERPTD